MPICTYLREHELYRPIANATVSEWLEHARKATGRRIQVQEHEFVQRRWFRKPLKLLRYQILWPVFDGIEHQVMNFYRDGSDWTLNTYVPAEMAVAYLMGCCCKTKDTK